MYHDWNLMPSNRDALMQWLRNRDALMQWLLVFLYFSYFLKHYQDLIHALMGGSFSSASSHNVSK